MFTFLEKLFSQTGQDQFMLTQWKLNANWQKDKWFTFMPVGFWILLITYIQTSSSTILFLSSSSSFSSSTNFPLSLPLPPPPPPPQISFLLLILHNFISLLPLHKFPSYSSSFSSSSANCLPPPPPLPRNFISLLLLLLHKFPVPPPPPPPPQFYCFHHQNHKRLYRTSISSFHRHVGSSKEQSRFSLTLSWLLSWATSVSSNDSHSTTDARIGASYS